MAFSRYSGISKNQFRNKKFKPLHHRHLLMAADIFPGPDGVSYREVLL